MAEMIAKAVVVLMALMAVPLGYGMYKKKLLDTLTILLVLGYIAIFGDMAGTPIFAWATDNVVLRFINEYLIINLFAITITLLAVLAINSVMKRVKSKLSGK